MQATATAFIVRTIEDRHKAHPLEVGQVVYKFSYNDYGCANDDSRLTHTEHISVCDTPIQAADMGSITIPIGFLMPVPHVEMVAKLAKKPSQFSVDIDCHNHRDAMLNLLHMGVGIADEYFEYCNASGKAHALEELGDMLFYTEGLLLFTGLDREKLLNMTTLCMPIERVLELLFGTIKRISCYAQGLLPEHLEAIGACYLQLLAWIENRAICHGFNMTTVRNANVGKLGKRYAKFEFSNEAAKERVDKKDGE